MYNERHKQDIKPSIKGGVIILRVCDTLDCLNSYNTPYNWLYVRHL